ncbi:MAG: DNA polymerase III subunit alpha [Caldiserica bacterium]|nr:DNA polymerase III subunit alpha [Caldisericota bacterium]MDH7562418.1 DNA polymerase III subunit alpha [Caldisericota bacterium]
MKFVHLRVHSDGSILDSTFTPERLSLEAQRLKMEAMALTDRDSLLRGVDFFQTAPGYGIRPILGLELSYFRGQPSPTPYTILLLAENERGYRKLISLLNSAHLRLKGNRPSPRIPPLRSSSSLEAEDLPQVELEEVLRDNQGLCALSGWKGSEAGNLLLEGDEEGASRSLGELKEAFGDRLFIELQWHGEEEERKLLRGLIRLSGKLQLPKVATNDVHYLQPPEERLYQILNCIRTLTRLGETHPKKKGTRNRHLRSESEMERAFSFCQEALRNTILLSERLNFSLPPYAPRLPHSGRTVEQEKALLEELCRSRLPYFYHPGERGQALARLEYELSIIKEMGYAGYFLLVHDLVEEARRRDIYVFGRGSAASSLVSYLLGITFVDPIKENLLFERFLNPARLNDPPDIDLDIERDRREELMDYVRQKYGEEMVVHVGGMSTFRLQGALREVGKALGKTKEEIDYFQESLPFRKVESGEAMKWLENARSLEGLIHHVTTHPSGFVITRGPAREELPLIVTPEGTCTQYDMRALARLGFLKMDFIGSRNLSIIQGTRKMLPPGWLKEIPQDDGATWEMISRGETLGCFQLESSGIRSLLRKLKPKNISDLTVALSLYRPGPIQGGMVESYIRRHHGKEPKTYLHPSLKPILEETHGVVLYQEQVMRIACEIGGFSLAEADILRRAMSDKEGEVLASMRERFLEGAKERGVSHETARKIYDFLEKFSGYGFNKAHSASYAIVSYQTAYLKRHFPREFFSVLLSTEEGYYQPFVYAEEARRMGARVLPPDLNRSQKHCTAENEGIRLGFSYIKDLGPSQIERIIVRRPQGGFKSFEEAMRLLHRDLDRKAFEALIKAGGMDSFGLTRSTMLASLPYHLRRLKERPSLLELEEKHPAFSLQSPREDEARDSWEFTGIYSPAHPLRVYKKELSSYLTNASISIRNLPRGSKIRAASLLTLVRLEKTRTGRRVGFLTLEDLDGQWEAILFPEELARFAPLLKAHSLLLLEGEVNERDGEKSLAVTDLKFLSLRKEERQFLRENNYWEGTWRKVAG